MLNVKITYQLIIEEIYPFLFWFCPRLTGLCGQDSCSCLKFYQAKNNKKNNWYFHHTQVSLLVVRPIFFKYPSCSYQLLAYNIFEK